MLWMFMFSALREAAVRPCAWPGRSRRVVVVELEVDRDVGCYHFGGHSELHAIVHRLIRSIRVAKGLVRASHLKGSRKYRRRVQICMHASESQTGDRIQTGIRTRDEQTRDPEPGTC